jgi:nitrogen fixation/metabolism regulation signal transduction histidine kinase
MCEEFTCGQPPAQADVEGGVGQFLERTALPAADAKARRGGNNRAREAELGLRPALDALPSNVAVLDAQGNILRVNRAWLEFARDNGDPPYEKIGVGANYCDVCRRASGEGSGYAAGALEGILSVLDGRRDRFEMEYPCHSPAERRWCLMRAIPYVDGDLRGAVVSHTFVTDRVVAAQEGMYIDLLCHDISNMVQVAAGYLELALSAVRRGEKIDRGQDFVVSVPLEVLSNIARLVGSIKQLHRAGMGHNAERIDVVGVLAELIGQFSRIPGREVDIRLTGVKGCDVVANDLVREVFANIIGNSVKHSRGPLRIDVDVARIAGDGADSCRVSIEDNGPGIPDDEKRQVLKCESLSERREEGMGFGLCLTRALVESFEGRLWIEDRVRGEYSKGVRFTVELPAAGPR